MHEIFGDVVVSIVFSVASKVSGIIGSSAKLFRNVIDERIDAVTGKIESSVAFCVCVYIESG